MSGQGARAQPGDHSAASLCSEMPGLCFLRARSGRGEAYQRHRPEVGAADLGGDAWMGGFFCPCHGSKFDLSGRVYSGVPASTNLVVPPYSFESQNVVVIGVDAEAA